MSDAKPACFNYGAYNTNYAVVQTSTSANLAVLMTYQVYRFIVKYIKFSLSRCASVLDSWAVVHTLEMQIRILNT
jgi:hypothetical protein